MACERWATSAFIVGGLGVLALSVAGALDEAAILSSPPWLHTIFLLGGIWFVFVGFIGFYPTVADSAPRTSTITVGASALGWIALSIALIGATIIDLTTQRSLGDPGPWAPPLLVAAFVLVVLSSLLYAVLTIRTGQPSSTIGLLLLVPFAAILGQVVLLSSKILTGDVLPVAQLILGGFAGLAFIGIGHLLRTEARQSGKSAQRSVT